MRPPLIYQNHFYRANDIYNNFVVESLAFFITKLNFEEKLFCIFAYLPKVTVQASIGGIVLSLGLECRGIILAVAVLAIVIIAPIGGFLIDIFGKKWLSKEDILNNIKTEIEKNT